MKRASLPLILLVLLAAGPETLTFAQHDLEMSQFGSVPQRINHNPAHAPIQHGYIGLPVISAMQAAYASPFAYSDVLTPDDDDSLILHVDKFIEKLSDRDMLRTNSDVTIFSFGQRIAKDRFFIDFSIRERFSQTLRLPRSLFYLAWYGNRAPEVFGQHVDIAPSVQLVAYDEYSFAFSGNAMKNKLSWGVRLKYLSGRFNIETVTSSFDFYTDTANYDLYMKSSLEVNTSGIDDIDGYLDQPAHKLIFPGNHGFSADIGFNYRINEKFEASASILDIGFIHWKDNTMKLVSHEPGAEFNFQGLTLKDFVELFKHPDDFGQKIEDSLRDLIHIDTVYGVAYSAAIPLRFNIGGSYILSDRHRFNLLFNGISWKGTFSPALSVSYNFRYKKFLETMVSYNLYNGQYTNIGGGLSVSAGPVQLYLASDNIPGLLFYKETNNYSFQVGINILLGRNRGIASQAPVEKEPGPAGDGSTPE